MGYYAETWWDLRFHSEASVEAVARMVAESDGRAGQFPESLIGLFNAEPNADLDGLHLSGYGSGKSWTVGEDEDWREIDRGPGLKPMPYNNGGEGWYSRLAPHVTGTIDWLGEEGDRWRIRFNGIGWHHFDGEVIYPGDTPE